MRDECSCNTSNNKQFTSRSQKSFSIIHQTQCWLNQSKYINKTNHPSNHVATPTFHFSNLPLSHTYMHLHTTHHIHTLTHHPHRILLKQKIITNTISQKSYHTTQNEHITHIHPHIHRFTKTVCFHTKIFTEKEKLQNPMNRLQIQLMKSYNKI